MKHTEQRWMHIETALICPADSIMLEDVRDKYRLVTVTWDEPEPKENIIKEALETLSQAMKEDMDYAWSWQCNLAMMAVDAGATHQQANMRAADLMKLLFGVDFRLRLKLEFGYSKPEPEAWESHIIIGALGNYVDLPSSATDHGGKKVRVEVIP